MQYKLKKEYTKYRLELCTPNKVPIAILNQKNSSIHNLHKISNENELTEINFNISLNDKISDKDNELLIKFEGEYYIIKTIDISTTDEMMTVNCIHEYEYLKSIPSSPVEVIGVTPQEMINAIMSASEISLGSFLFETDITDTNMKRSIVNDKSTDTPISVWENLVEMVEKFESSLELSTTENGVFKIFLRYHAIDNGKFVKMGLQNINVNIDSNEIFTRIVAFGYTKTDGFKLSLLDTPLSGGKSYISDYSYFISKGMTEEECLAHPQCQATNYWEDENIVDADDLYYKALEQLERTSQPKLDGSVEMSDMKVFDGFYMSSPRMSEEIKFITDNHFVIKARVISFDRNYDDPSDIQVGVSNVRNYTSDLGDLIHSTEKIDKITSVTDNELSVNSSYLKGQIDAIKNSFGTTVEDATQMNETAIQFSDTQVNTANYGSVAIGTRGLLLSTEQDENGNWIWSTAITSKGMIADLISTGILTSKNGNCWIDLDSGEWDFNGIFKFDGNELTLNFPYITGDEVDNKLGDIKDSADSALNGVNDIKNNGVDKVANTIVKINNEGISVAKDGDEYSSLQDNKGFYIKSYGTEKARFDKDGFKTGYGVLERAQIGHLRFENMSVGSDVVQAIHFIEDLSIGGITMSEPMMMSLDLENNYEGWEVD